MIKNFTKATTGNIKDHCAKRFPKTVPQSDNKVKSKDITGLGQ